MRTIAFNLKQMCFDRRVTLPEVSMKTGVPYPSIWGMYKRGTIKLSFLRELESHFGDCSEYILKSDINHGKRVA
jgi:hypothetical protein